MNHHILKLNENYWNDVMEGNKTFEVRKNDRGFQKGDTVQFDKVDSKGSKTGGPSSKTFEITYVYGGDMVPHGYCVFAIKGLF